MRVGDSDIWASGQEPEAASSEADCAPVEALSSDGIESEPPAAAPGPAAPATSTGAPLTSTGALLAPTAPSSPLRTPLGGPGVLGLLPTTFGQVGSLLSGDPFTTIFSAAKTLFDGASGGFFPLVQTTFDACKYVVDEVGDFSQDLDLDGWCALGDFLGDLEDLDFTGIDEEAGRLIENLRHDTALQLIVGGYVGTSLAIYSQSVVHQGELFTRRWPDQDEDEQEKLVEQLARRRREEDVEERAVQPERIVEVDRTDIIVVGQDDDGEDITREIFVALKDGRPVEKDDGP